MAVVTPDLPKLRSDLRQSRQERPEGAVFVLKDPMTGRYFRFGEGEQFIAQQLDGATSMTNAVAAVVAWRTAAGLAVAL